MNPSVVCFANDWTASPTGKHHLMRRYAAEWGVLWVEASGMRRPSLTSGRDVGRIFRKLKSFARRSREVEPGLHVLSPPSIPLPGSRPAEALNRWLYARSIRREVDRLGFSGPLVLWLFTPHVAPYISSLPRSLLVYYCVDRWSEFAEYDADLMNRRERKVCESADHVFASALDLADQCRKYSDCVDYLPHGVDYAHFSSALDDGPVPNVLGEKTCPRIGFFGLIDEWFDLELVEALADRTGFEFVLIGDVNVEVPGLEARANVRLLGRRPYEELPDFCRTFDAAIIPFLVNHLTRSVNPIKLREYAAAGLPVISSALPEIEHRSDIAVCPRSLDAWEEALRDAVRSGGDPGWRTRQSKRVEDEDWDGIFEKSRERLMPLLEHSLS